MKVSRKIKSAVIVIFALLAGSMSFQASASGYYYSYSYQYQPVPRPQPRCHTEWRYDWAYDGYGNRYEQRQSVRICN